MAKKIVLAIDDINMNLLLIKETLSEFVNVYVARSGQAALETVKLINVDLFLLDLEMPEMDGFDFLQRLRTNEQYATTPVIIISSNAKSNTIARAVALGVTDYLTKPFKREQLREKVLKALNGGTYEGAEPPNASL